jgi:hypothetical protein
MHVLPICVIVPHSKAAEEWSSWWQEMIPTLGLKSGDLSVLFLVAVSAGLRTRPPDLRVAVGYSDKQPDC